MVNDIAIILVLCILVTIQQISIVYSVEHPPWCPIRESGVKYFIRPDLDQYAMERGYYNLLNTQVIENAAEAWNNGREIYEGRWAVLTRVYEGDYNIYINISHTCQQLGYTDPYDCPLLACFVNTTVFPGVTYYTLEIEELHLISNYYINSTHVQYVLAHEFGHALGLNDTNMSNTLMYCYDIYAETGISGPTEWDAIQLNAIICVECHDCSDNGIPTCPPDQYPFCPIPLSIGRIHSGGDT